MPKSVFPYPGGKTMLSDWVIQHFPDHRCYVEVFGGSAAVLVNKPRSHIEIINDRDADISHFFTVLRNDGEELYEWLQNVEYSYDLYRKWAGRYYAGNRPDDDVKRAGQWFYLRYTQFAGKYDGVKGFHSASTKTCAKRFLNSCDKLLEFRDRFKGVQIENRDFEEIITRFDGEDTLFYCDPPYVDVGDEYYSHEGAFDHARLAETLAETDGDWVVSYMDIPPEFPECHVVEREESQHMNKAHSERRESATERLLMNFDPEQTPSFSEANQSALTAYGGR